MDDDDPPVHNGIIIAGAVVGFGIAVINLTRNTAIPFEKKLISSLWTVPLMTGAGASTAWLLSTTWPVDLTVLAAPLSIIAVHQVYG